MPIPANFDLVIGMRLRHDRNPIRGIVSMMEYRLANGIESDMVRLVITEGGGVIRPPLAPARSGRTNVTRMSAATISRNAPVLQVQPRQEYAFQITVIRSEWSVETDDQRAQPIPQRATAPEPKVEGGPTSRFDRDDLF